MLVMLLLLVSGWWVVVWVRVIGLFRGWLMGVGEVKGFLLLRWMSEGFMLWVF